MKKRHVGIVVTVYELVAFLAPGKVPQITEICRAHPRVKWSVIGWVIYHLAIDKGPQSIPAGGLAGLERGVIDP